MNNENNEFNNFQSQPVVDQPMQPQPVVTPIEPAPIAEPQPVVQPAPVVPPAQPEPAVEQPEPVVQSSPQKKKSKAWIIIVIVVLLVAGLACGAYFLFFNKDGSSLIEKQKEIKLDNPYDLFAGSSDECLLLVKGENLHVISKSGIIETPRLSEETINYKCENNIVMLIMNDIDEETGNHFILKVYKDNKYIMDYEYENNEYNDIFSSMVGDIEDNLVFIKDGNNIVAIDINSKTIKWKKKFSSYASFAYNGFIFENKKLYDKKTGEFVVTVDEIVNGFYKVENKEEFLTDVYDFNNNKLYSIETSMPCFTDNSKNCFASSTLLTNGFLLVSTSNKYESDYDLYDSTGTKVKTVNGTFYKDPIGNKNYSMINPPFDKSIIVFTKTKDTIISYTPSEMSSYIKGSNIYILRYDDDLNNKILINTNTQKSFEIEYSSFTVYSSKNGDYFILEKGYHEGYIIYDSDFSEIKRVEQKKAEAYFVDNRRVLEYDPLTQKYSIFDTNSKEMKEIQIDGSLYKREEFALITKKDDKYTVYYIDDLLK